MFIKFCEAKHNLAKVCTTVGIGTLQVYAEDDQKTYRYDGEEGHHNVINNGVAMHIGGYSADRLPNGELAPFGVMTPPGARFQTSFQFPNCYVFCFSQEVTPTVELAKELSDKYDDWFAINEPQQFASLVGQLLLNQLSLSDLDVADNKPLNWFSGLNMQVVHRACSYDGRLMELNPGAEDQVVHLDNNMIQWAFAKEPGHAHFKEYRILFVLRDAQGQIVPVKKNAKVVKLMPDLGVSTCEVPMGDKSS